jgi:ABC-type dipeptide/oligopeptide/nickel transport system permease subunit
MDGDRAPASPVSWAAESPAGYVLRRLAKNRGATAGGALLVALVGMATFAPLIAGYDPIQTRLRRRAAGRASGTRSGTDRYGRLFSRIVFDGGSRSRPVSWP